MSRMLASVCALSLLATAPSWAAADTKLVPALKKPAKVDGNLQDLAGGLPLKPAAGDAWTGRVAYQKDALWLGVESKGDTLELTLQFPGAGTTAQGRVLTFTADGLQGSQTGTEKLIESKVVRKDSGLVVEAAIPARALPRFPAKEPLVFDLCVSSAGSTNCTQGTMAGGALRLPDDFRKALKLKVPESVVGIEGRPEGWVGYAVLHYPVWVSADVPLTATVLRRLVTDQPVDPRSAGINLPEELVLPDGQRLLSVLSGRDPYEVQGACDADRELRLGLYLVRGRTAERVLDWPASTCPLGRAVAIELDEQGELTLGYTNGATVTFLWSKDHFERTEIGSR